MTTTLPATAVSPVADRMRRDAEAEAARLRSAARAEAAALTQRAHRDAAQTVAAAEADAAAAAPLTAGELRRAHAAARSAVLSAQRQACDELRSQVRAAVALLPGQSGYDRLMDRISGLAGQAAGPTAWLTLAPGGGVLARATGVIVDCSLDRLADLAVAELGSEFPELWTP
jgi:vacuolar-type H+-ATPase subunit E/Vma4